MPVNTNYSGVGSYTNSGRAKEPEAVTKPDGTKDYSEFFSSKNSNTVSSQDFFNLMAAQLKNQDFNNPMDNSQMLAQMAQFQTMEVMQTLAYNMNQNLAVSMIGKTVVIGEMGSDGQLKVTEGVVEKVGLAGGTFQYFVNGKSYTTENIMEIKSEASKNKPELTLDEIIRTSTKDAELTFKSSKTGSYYFDIVDEGSEIPTIDTTGKGVEFTESPVKIPLILTPGAKDVYVCVKDANGVISNMLKVNVKAYEDNTDEE